MWSVCGPVGVITRSSGCDQCVGPVGAVARCTQWMVDILLTHNEVSLLLFVSVLLGILSG